MRDDIYTEKEENTPIQNIGIHLNPITMFHLARSQLLGEEPTKCINVNGLQGPKCFLSKSLSIFIPEFLIRAAEPDRLVYLPDKVCIDNVGIVLEHSRLPGEFQRQYFLYQYQIQRGTGLLRKRRRRRRREKKGRRSYGL